GEFDGINWFYVVRAEDAVGNEEMNTVAVPEIPIGNVPPSVPSIPTPADTAIGIGLNPALSARVADPNGDVMDVSFYDASGPTLIGTDTNVASGTFASVNWNGLSADTTYDWYVVADDGEFTTQSPTWSFTTIDTTPPAPPTGLTVEWWGSTTTTLIDEDFVGGFPPPGWAQFGPDLHWTQSATANAGGTSPEANYHWQSVVNYWGLYAGPLDTTGMVNLTLRWDNWYNDFGIGLACKVQTSTDASTWHDTGWEIISGTGDVGPGLQTYDISTADVGSSTFYIGFTLDGDTYQLDDWWIDNVLLTYIGGGTTDDNWLNWTLSADDGGGANDVAQYNIYRANNAGGPWDAGALIDTVPAGTDTYMDFGRGQPDGINWWYVVRAEDVWGNEELNTNAVPEIPVGDMPPTVTVGTPNGGESYPVDSLISINWAAGDDNPWPATSCWIYYDTDTNPGNGETFITSAVSAGAGTYDWDSTGVPPDDYYIHIVVEDSIGQQAEDWSDGFFTITPPTYDIDL
ncbi:MAG: hypothetical protein KAX31_06445, partial [Thermoplasmata archaeon]|nr:hypothetical protein [Thermoplasmata archaeon]